MLVKLPPLVISNVPLPELPTVSPLLLVHVEPGPVIVTMPFEPPKTPMMLDPPAPLLVVRVPPFWTVSVPVPDSPTQSWSLFVQVEPVPLMLTVPTPVA